MSKLRNKLIIACRDRVAVRILDANQEADGYEYHQNRRLLSSKRTFPNL